ncbi:MAG: Retron-type reverse transcriptase [Candidatus Magasanikbacteria bacterium]|nr:Retron-type reverse transcriptase [Candidatus Magasanikbacteria bacterium]
MIKSFDELISFASIFSAWREFRSGKNNKLDVMSFERNLEDNLFVLYEELASRTYKHSPYHTFHVWDPKHRVISKATVRDRVVHHLVFRELYRSFNPTFIFHSYSSRIGRGAHLAVQNLSDALRAVSYNYTKPTFALKCDIKQFFATVSHQKLLATIQRKIKDSQLLWLVEEIIAGFSSPLCLNNKIPLGGGLKETFLLPPKWIASSAPHRRFLAMTDYP